MARVIAQGIAARNFELFNPGKRVWGVTGGQVGVRIILGDESEIGNRVGVLREGVYKSEGKGHL